MKDKYSRQNARKYLFQKLFSNTYTKNEDNDLFNDAFLIDDYKKAFDNEYVEKMFLLIKKNEYKLIALLEKYTPKFSLDKMDIFFVLPIFIAATEMFWLDEEIPGKVSINEAIELSKKYWTETSYKIVNWVLNNVLNDYNVLKL